MSNVTTYNSQGQGFKPSIIHGNYSNQKLIKSVILAYVKKKKKK